MFQPKASEPNFQNEPTEAPPLRKPSMTRQHQLMLGSLMLLVIALGMLLYNDRDFWFPDTLDADDSLAGPATVSAHSGTTAAAAPHVSGRHAASKIQPSVPAPGAATDPQQDLPPVTAVRTVLPPLQVEVVAGDVHHTVRPGSNSVHVDMQPGGEPQTLVDPPSPSVSDDTTAAVTSNAAENVQLSANTSQVVSHSVPPSYPLLARQTKVQGSVILQAVINRDGSIQDLHIVSGSPILAGAAREAVRQWHFKPHYEGAEPVETVAKITVNFQILTN